MEVVACPKEVSNDPSRISRLLKKIEKLSVDVFFPLQYVGMFFAFLCKEN